MQVATSDQRRHTSVPSLVALVRCVLTCTPLCHPHGRYYLLRVSRNSRMTLVFKTKPTVQHLVYGGWGIAESTDGGRLRLTVEPY